MPRGVQRYREVVISGIAHVDAPHRVTSAELESRFERTLTRLRMRPGLLERLAGIEARHFWDEGVMPSEAAASAGEKALADWGGDREEIGILVNTSVSRDYIEPSTASLVHGRLGLPPESTSFDLSNACLGFLNGMNVVAAMIERGEVDHGLVVNAESARFGVESTVARLARDDADAAAYRDQFATLTLGSGAVAMVLSRGDLAPGGHRYLGGLSRAATQHAHLSTAQVDQMRTDAAGLLAAGLELAAATWKEAVDAFDLGDDTVDLYAVHQVSKVHTRAVAETLGVDHDKMPLTFPEYGNMGPASVPTVVSKAAADGTLAPGHRVVLMGIGSGLNASAAEIVW